MPNWCHNVMYVRGEKKDLQAFDKIFKGFPDRPPEGKSFADLERKYSFNALYPIPNDEDWYKWSVDNWGTKWDIYYSDYTGAFFCENEYTYTFDTAWSPPEPWLKHVSTLFPTLEFEIQYYEPGIMFAGTTKYKNGQTTEEIFFERRKAFDYAVEIGLEAEEAVEMLEDGDLDG